MKRLIIAPHVSDDVLGCGGILDESCVVFYCGVGDDSAVRNTEAKAVAERVGSHFWWPVTSPPFDTWAFTGNKPTWPQGAQSLIYPTVRTVNAYDQLTLIRDIEVLLAIEEPDEVYLPDPASHSQDHQTAYNAAMVALRPHDELPFVKRVLIYEQPHVVLWPTSSVYQPNYFRQIDAQEKLQRYRLMPSQVRDHRSAAHLVAMAQIRGKMANVPEAEAFRILRWVE